MVRLNYFPLTYPYRVYLEQGDNEIAFDELSGRYGCGGAANDSNLHNRWVKGRGLPSLQHRNQYPKVTGIFYGFRRKQDATDFYLRYG